MQSPETQLTLRPASPHKLTEIIPDVVEPGVTYDNSVYYVNVYVTNVLKEDKTPLLGTNGLPVV